jgi:DNA-3-methyladenine glycosylase I
MNPYCAYCQSHPEDSLNRIYHDTQYGFPLEQDDQLFERLILEINQAGLSWTLILKKAGHFKRAYDGFDLETVAAYGESERARLLADPGIIRNRLKVNAAIENARRILNLKAEFGSFKGWLDAHHPRNLEDWVKLFKKNLLFTGGEIVGEFLMSTGYLPGAHSPDCPIFERVREQNPPWMLTRRPV